MIALPSFVHLHVHSEYSLVDGIIRIEDLIEISSQRNEKTIALTDQSNLFALVKFYSAAVEAGIKPIIGSDVWIQNEEDIHNPFRLILLCQNEIGYKNLIELVTTSYIQGQHLGKPLIRKESLSQFNQGLIAIAGMRESDIGQALINAQWEIAESLVDNWVALFCDRFYLELTRTGRLDEEDTLEAILGLAEKKGCPVVATNDARFCDREDFEAHEARVAIYEGRILNDPNRPKLYSENQYLKSSKEMEALFSDIPEALQNSCEIAKRCNLKIKLGKVFLPNYPVPEGFTIEEFLIKEAEKGFQKRFSQGVRNSEEDVYQERLKTELSVINSMGFAGYFLIVADFISWAKKNDIPVGPGRGSGAGSLVAYVLQITDLDPIHYDLLFERFLNPERIDMPDFDIDFCMEGRDRVIDYVTQTYGRESVSQIITYGTLAAKAVIRDVGRVLGHPYGFVDKIAKLIPLELGITLEKALASEELLKQRYEEEEEVKNLIDLAKKLEGITRNAGKHAGGVVIAPSKLTDFSPLYRDAEEGSIVTQFDKIDVEKIGLVKFDFLGLRTLTIVDWATKIINQKKAENNEDPLDISTIPLDDKATFNLLKDCRTTAVFQLESRGMTDLVRRLQPDIFDEIIALVALFRPGPLQSGMVDDFINRKQGKAKLEYLHPSLTSILKPTYGIILYQEQVMLIAQVLAGYTLGGADLLRRAMGKKKPEEMAKQRAIFTKGATDRGVNARTATHIFDLMEKFAGYGFNKPHAAAYALLTYQTAWLKTHYPAAFMAAVLSSDMNHTDKVVVFVEECKQINIKVLPPNINESHYKFSVNQNNEILYGLGAIKGVGESAITSIEEARAKNSFRDLFDFCARVDLRKVSKRVLEALIRSGAMDCFGFERAWLMSSLEDAVESAQQILENRESGQGDLFGECLSIDDVLIHQKPRDVSPWSDSVRLQGEKDTLGFYLTGHPLDQYEKELRKLASTCVRDLKIEKNKKQVIAGLIVAVKVVQTKTQDRMLFMTVDDKTGRQEVTVFSDLFRVHKEKLQKDRLVIVEGEVSPDNYSGGLRMRAIDIFDLDTRRSKIAKFLLIELINEQMTEDFSKRLKAILTNYRGEKTYIKMVYPKPDKNAKVVLNLGNNWKIKPATTLIEQLKAMVEIKTVEVEY